MKRMTMLKKIALCATTLFVAFGWAAAPAQDQVTTVAEKLVAQDLQGLLPGRTVNAVERITLEDTLGVWAVKLAPAGHLILADSTKYRPLISFSEYDFAAPEKDTPHYASLLAAAQRVAAAEAAEGEENAAWYTGGVSLFATSADPSTEGGTISAQPIDTAAWYQFNALAWYVPGNAPCGCVATAQAQGMHGLQWPVYPETTFSANLNYTNVNDSSLNSSENYTFNSYSKFDYAVMDTVYANLTTNTAANHEVARLTLLNDILSNMVFKDGGASTTTVPPAVITPWMTAPDMRTRASTSAAFTDADKTAIEAAMKAGYSVVCNTPTHAVLAGGYATIDGVPYVRLNYGYATMTDSQDLGTAWYSLNDNNVTTFAITAPTKTVQCEPLPAISSNSPTISWHIPKCYAGGYTDSVSSFTVKAIPLTGDPATWTCSDFTAGMLSGNTKLLHAATGKLTANAYTETVNMDPRSYYTAEPLFVPTANSEWNTTYSLDYPNGYVDFQILPLGGTWTTLERLEVTASASQTTKTINLGAYAGKPCKLRYVIACATMYSDAFLVSGLSVTETLYATGNSSADKSETVDDKTRSCTLTDLTAGTNYAFTVTPLFGKDEGATGYCYARIADGSNAEESFATFEVTSPSTEAQSNENMRIGDGFFRYCTYNGTSYIRVNAGEKVTELKTYSSHPTAFPDDAFTVTSYNNGIFDIKVDNTKIPESPRVNDRVNLSLVATTDAGTISSHELSLAFTTDTKFAVTETAPTAPTPGDDPVDPETPSATTTPVPGDWTELALPDEKVPEAKASFMGYMGAGNSQGAAEGAEGVLTTKLAAVKHGDVWPGTNGDPQYCETGANAEGGEGYWSGSSISLFGRYNVEGMSALIVPVSGQIPHGTVIEKLRVKATIRGSYNNGASKTVAGNCAVAIGHATYDADDAKAYVYTATANAAGNGGNGTDTQIEATLTFANAITWVESGDNPDMIVLAVSTPRTRQGPYIVEINSVEYFTAEPALATPVLLLDFGQATAIDDSNTEWKTLTEMSGKPGSPQGESATYSHTYDSTVLGGGYSLTHSFTGAGRCFDNGIWTGTFAEGVFTSPDKAQAYASALAEMKATLGLINDIPLGVYGDSSYTAQDGYRTQKFDFTGLNAEKYYVLYFIGGLSNSDGNRYPGFQLTTYNTAVTPVLSWARHTDTAYTTVDDPSAQINGDANTGAIIVRMHNVKPDANGNLSITVNSRKSPTNAIAIAESDLIEVPAPVSHTRELNDATEAWETPLSEWTGSKLPKPADTVTLNVTGNGGALTVDSTVAVEQLTVSGDKALTVTGSGSITVGTSTAINASTDVSGITATLGTISGTGGKILTVGPGTTVPSSVSNVTIGFSGTEANPLQYASEEKNVNSWAKFINARAGTYTYSGYMNVAGYSNDEEVDDEKGWWRVRAAQTLNIVPGANITATRLVTSDNGSAVTTIYQTGGTITLSGTETDCTGTGTNAVLLGHWPATTTYNLKAGSLLAENGALNLGWDGSALLTIGQDSGETTALVSVKRFSGSVGTNSRNGNASVTIKPTGTLQIGSGGLDLPTNKSFTLAGGTLAVTDDATIAISHTNGLNITEDSTISVAENATARYAGTVKGSSILTKTGSGTLNLAGATLPTDLKYTVKAGMLILPAGKETTATIGGGTLILQLSDEQMATGYTAQVASGTVTFYDSKGELIEGDTVNGNIYTPALNTWTPTKDNTWSNTENWSTGATPGNTDNIQIEINTDTELTLPGDISVGIINVFGSGTLTIAGGKLTATKVIASANITVTGDTLALVPMVINENVTVDYTTTADVDLPALTGEGTFVKRGTHKVTMQPSLACDPVVEVAAGLLFFNNAQYDMTYNLVVKNGASVQLGTWAGSIRSQASVITLEGGAKLILKNGNKDYHGGARIDASVVIESTEENPAIIQGSAYGSNSTIVGPVSGTGVLELRRDGDSAYNISGVISGTLKVKVSTTNGVTLSGVNTHTGGTEVVKDAVLTLGNKAALPAGSLAGEGTVKIDNKDNLPEEAIASADWTGTVQLSSSMTGVANLTLSRLTNEKSVIEIPEGVKVDGYLANEVARSLGGLTLNGELELTNGFRDGRYVFNGALTGSGTFDLDHNNPADFICFAGEVSGFTGTFEVAGVRSVTIGTKDTADRTRASGCVVIDTGRTIAIADGKTWTAGCYVYGTLAGAGTISGTLTLSDEATLDASAGTLTANGIAYTDNAKITIKLPADLATPVLKTTSTTLPAKYTLMQGENVASTYMLVAKTENDVAGFYAVKPTVPEITIDEEKVAVSDSNLAKIQAAAAAAKVQTVTSIEGAVLVPADGDIPAKTVDLAGLELFDNVDVAVDKSGKATVSYAFGITSVTVVTEETEKKVVVKAKVSKLDATDGPTFANDIRVELCNGSTETVIDSETVEMGASEVTITTDASILETLGTGVSSKTLSLTVKATNEAQQNQ